MVPLNRATPGSCTPKGVLLIPLLMDWNSLGGPPEEGESLAGSGALNWAEYGP